MSGFEGHLKTGIIFYVLFLIVGTFGISTYATMQGGTLPLLPIGLLVVAFPLGLIGAMFPDIDHHASKPFKMFKRLVTGVLIVGVLAGAYIFSNTLIAYVPASVAPSVPDVAFVVAGAGLACGFIVLSTGPVLRIVQPKHRGTTHRMPTGILVSGVLAGISVWLGSQVSAVPELFVGGAIFSAFLVGFASHLYADGLLFKLKTYTSLR